MDKKNELIELLKKNKKSLIIVLGGFLFGIVLNKIGGYGFVSGLGILITIAAIGYGAFIAFKIKMNKTTADKARAEDEKKAKKEEAIQEFKNTLKGNIDNILKVIAGDATKTNFEHGLKQVIENSGTSLEIEEVLPLAQEELLVRMSPDDANTPAFRIFAEYFYLSMRDTLISAYIPWALREEKSAEYTSIAGGTELINEAKIPFIKTLYGFSVRAYNYSKMMNGLTDYSPINNEFLENLVATDDIISSYCKSNPFELEKKQKEWIKDIKESAYKAVSSYSLKINLEKNEEILDVLCYCGYSLLCDSNEDELEFITTNILKSIEDEYKKIRR